MSEDLPPDPFKTGLSDLAQFAANAFSMYTALMGAGFTDAQALQFTIGVTVQMIAVSMPEVPKPDGSA